MKRILHTLHKLHTEQTAQGMVFGAISLFLMASSVGLVHNSGVITSRRVQAQTAADAGAYAGALSSANILSDVAWMNDGMAYIYYNLMRYSVDVTVTRTVAEMRTHNKWYLRNGNTYPDTDYIDPKPLSQEYRDLERLIGTDDPEQAYADAYDTAAKMIPKGERWLKLMTRMEYAMLAAGKYLVRDAVYKAAVGSSASAETDDERNIAAVAIVQNLYDVNFLTTGAEDIDLILEYDADGAPLWSFIENGKLYAEIWKLGPDHWRMVRPGIQTIDILRFGDQDWEIRTGDLIARITKNADGSIELTVTGTTAAHLTLVPIGDNLWLVSGTAAGVSVQYKPFRDGGYELTVNGVTVGIRFSGGKLQQFVGGNWVDLPSPDTVDIGGEQVKVNISNHIDLPGSASLDFPGKLNLGPISFTIPDQIHFANMDITLLRDSVKITGRIGRVGIVIDGSRDNCAVVEGLSTCDDASAKKRATHNPDGHDRIETLIPGKKWQYKWR
ncbi:MAG TPA: pilus assembly protein TadG-related protein, partial [Planctomycetota bacterium]|nr:pilus assembly protein TadG-related protein [Planctomycetota bacterium]